MPRKTRTKPKVAPAAEEEKQPYQATDSTRKNENLQYFISGINDTQLSSDRKQVLISTMTAMLSGQNGCNLKPAAIYNTIRRLKTTKGQYAPQERIILEDIASQVRKGLRMVSQKKSRTAAVMMAPVPTHTVIAQAKPNVRVPNSMRDIANVIKTTYQIPDEIGAINKIIEPMSEISLSKFPTVDEIRNKRNELIALQNKLLNKIKESNPAIDKIAHDTTNSKLSNEEQQAVLRNLRNALVEHSIPQNTEYCARNRFFIFKIAGAYASLAYWDIVLATALQNECEQDKIYNPELKNTRESQEEIENLITTSAINLRKSVGMFQAMRTAILQRHMYASAQNGPPDRHDQTLWQNSLITIINNILQTGIITAEQQQQLAVHRFKQIYESYTSKPFDLQSEDFGKDMLNAAKKDNSGNSFFPPNTLRNNIEIAKHISSRSFYTNLHEDLAITCVYHLNHLKEMAHHIKDNGWDDEKVFKTNMELLRKLADKDHNVFQLVASIESNDRTYPKAMPPGAPKETMLTAFKSYCEQIHVMPEIFPYIAKQKARELDSTATGAFNDFYDTDNLSLYIAGWGDVLEISSYGAGFLTIGQHKDEMQKIASEMGRASNATTRAQIESILNEGEKQYQQAVANTAYLQKVEEEECKIQELERKRAEEQKAVDAKQAEIDAENQAAEEARLAQKYAAKQLLQQQAAAQQQQLINHQYAIKQLAEDLKLMGPRQSDSNVTWAPHELEYLRGVKMFREGDPQAYWVLKNSYQMSISRININNMAIPTPDYVTAAKALSIGADIQLQHAYRLLNGGRGLDAVWNLRQAHSLLEEVLLMRKQAVNVLSIFLKNPYDPFNNIFVNQKIYTDVLQNMWPILAQASEDTKKFIENAKRQIQRRKDNLAHKKQEYKAKLAAGIIQHRLSIEEWNDLSQEQKQAVENTKTTALKMLEQYDRKFSTLEKQASQLSIEAAEQFATGREISVQPRSPMTIQEIHETTWPDLQQQESQAFDDSHLDKTTLRPSFVTAIKGGKYTEEKHSGSREIVAANREASETLIAKLELHLKDNPNIELDHDDLGCLRFKLTANNYTDRFHIKGVVRNIAGDVAQFRENRNALPGDYGVGSVPNSVVVTNPKAVLKAIEDKATNISPDGKQQWQRQQRSHSVTQGRRADLTV